jgi:hypothetical protein
MKLTDHFSIKKNETSGYSWELITHNSLKTPLESLAEILSDKIIEFRCQRAKKLYAAWRGKKYNGIDYDDIINKSLIGFIEPAFGSPNSKKRSEDHIIGLVAQYLWYFMVKELSTDRIIDIKSPGFAVTDGGGDGVLIHEINKGEFYFRLWEIKKNTGPTTQLNQTVNNAYSQLNSKALEYIARYLAEGQESDNESLNTFYGKMQDFWINHSKEANVGIAISTNLTKVSEDCFENFNSKFPEFQIKDQLKGMLSVIDDFGSFSEKVKEEVWKGL